MARFCGPAAPVRWPSAGVGYRKSHARIRLPAGSTHSAGHPGESGRPVPFKNGDRGEDRRKSPPREGPALLQGLVLCGRCGERMTVRYRSHHGRLLPIYVCQKAGIASAQPICQSIVGASLDDAIWRAASGSGHATCPRGGAVRSTGAGGSRPGGRPPSQAAGRACTLRGRARTAPLPSR